MALRWARQWGLLSVVVAVLATCDDTPFQLGGGDADALVIHSSRVELLFAQGLPPHGLQLYVSEVLETGEGRDVQPIWRSTDTAVVKVSETGRIETSSRPGTAL